jgi:hypothetical protein
MVDVDMGRATTYDEIAVGGCSLSIFSLGMVYDSRLKY